MKYDTERLKRTQIEILDYINEVCHKNNISYFLYYGTLLGAIRHNGFIPWDDDIDIALVRMEYEKLIKLLKKNPNQEYFLQTTSTEKNSPVIFSKIRKKNTVCIERSMININYNNGIFIDIFPLDYIDKKMSIKYYILSIIIKIIDSVRSAKIQKRRVRKISDIIIFPLRILSVTLLNTLVDIIIRKINKTSKKYYTSYLAGSAKNEIINEDWLFPYKKHIFEGKYYKIPNKYKLVLEVLYGKNYMNLPDEKDRRTHSFENVTWE